MNETFTCQIYKITNIQTIESEFRVHTLEFVNTEVFFLYSNYCTRNYFA